VLSRHEMFRNLTRFYTLTFYSEIRDTFTRFHSDKICRLNSPSGNQPLCQFRILLSASKNALDNGETSTRKHRLPLLSVIENTKRCSDRLIADFSVAINDTEGNKRHSLQLSVILKKKMGIGSSYNCFSAWFLKLRRVI